MLESRSAISRRELLNRPSAGHVAGDPEESAFGGIGVFVGKEFVHVGNRDPRFPDRIRAVHWQGHVAGDPAESGIGELKVPCT
jgi:hypothetical protein